VPPGGRRASEKMTSRWLSTEEASFFSATLILGAARIPKTRYPAQAAPFDREESRNNTAARHGRTGSMRSWPIRNIKCSRRIRRYGLSFWLLMTNRMGATARLATSTLSGRFTCFSSSIVARNVKPSRSLCPTFDIESSLASGATISRGPVHPATYIHLI
jgi:hypothetical protein